MDTHNNTHNSIEMPKPVTQADPQLKRWDITISCAKNPLLLKEELIELFNQGCDKYVFQREKSHEGYLHWQIRIDLMKRKRRKEVQKWLAQAHPADPVVVNVAAITPTSNAAGGSFSYVMKDDTRVEGPWSNIRLNPRFNDIRRGPLFSWQQAVLELPFSARDIHFIHELKGGQGKSTFAQWLESERKECIYLMNFLKGPEELIADVFANSKEGADTFIILDLPRQQPPQKVLETLTAVLERLANGMVTEPRYRAQKKQLGLTKIVVFSNYRVDLDLSVDRIKHYVIRDKFLFRVHGPDDPDVAYWGVNGEELIFPNVAPAVAGFGDGAGPEGPGGAAAVTSPVARVDSPWMFEVAPTLRLPGGVWDLSHCDQGSPQPNGEMEDPMWDCVYWDPNMLD